MKRKIKKIAAFSLILGLTLQAASVFAQSSSLDNELTETSQIVSEVEEQQLPEIQENNTSIEEEISTFESDPASKTDLNAVLARSQIKYIFEGEERIFDGTKTVEGTEADKAALKAMNKGSVIIKYKTGEKLETPQQYLLFAAGKSSTNDQFGSIATQNNGIRIRYPLGMRAAFANQNTEDGNWHTIIYSVDATTTPYTNDNTKPNRTTVNIDGRYIGAFPNWAVWYNATSDINDIQHLTIGGFSAGMFATNNDNAPTNFIGEIGFVAIVDEAFTQEEANALTSASQTPIITQNLPAEVSSLSTTKLEAKAEISDGGTLTYQWYKDDVAIEGETKSVLSLKENGTYKVKITNTNGARVERSIFSSECTVAINLTVNASSKEIKTGKVAKLTASEGGTSYQWFINDEEITGTNSNIYEFISDKMGEYSFYCVVDNFKSNTVSINVTKDVEVKAPESTTIEIGETIPFEVNEVEEIPNATYEWYVSATSGTEGATKVGDSKSFNFSQNKAGAYYVYCVIKSEDGKQTIISDFVFVSVGKTLSVITSEDTVEPGSIVDVKIKLSGIEKGQGVAGAKFRLNFNPDKLTPVLYEKLGAFNSEGVFSTDMKGNLDELSYITFGFVVDENFKTDGDVLSIRFRVNSNASDEQLLIELDDGFCEFIDKDEKDVTIALGNGVIKVSSSSSGETIYYGDVDNDQKVTTKDLTKLLRHLAGYTDSQLTGVWFKAADVDVDGKVTTKDLIRLLQYLAKWNVELGKR